MKSQTALIYRRRRRRFSVVILVTLLVIGYALYGQVSVWYQNRSNETAHKTDIDTERLHELTPAVEALGKLAVKDRVFGAKYDREQFSSDWVIVAGCDMRNRVLQRDLNDVALDEDACTVLSGVLTEDPFTGKKIAFKRGSDTSDDIHIEHIVAVSDAWAKGAQDLTMQEREEFYNDPLNLMAVDGPANVEKGGQDASGWLPNKGYQCRYIARQIAVKVKYALWVTKAEYEAMKRVLRTCPQQPLPLVTDYAETR